MIRFRWLLLTALMLACLAACAPAAQPSATPTAALPATESSQPTTIVNTPTIERTPRLSALPEQGVKFPGTFEPLTSVTEEDLARQSDAFDALYDQYPDLKADADRMVQNLNKLAQAQGIQIITKGYAWENDGDITWGIVAMDSQGYGYIIQKKTSDTTYLSNSNISAYDVLHTGTIDPNTFRLLRIKKPDGLPDTAVARVVNLSGYKTWAWTDPDGTVLAVLSIPDDAYKRRDGSIIKEVVYSYRPFSEMITAEDCYNQILPSVDDPTFEAAWDAYRKAVKPEKMPILDDYWPLVTSTLMYPVSNNKALPTAYTYGWQFSHIGQDAWKITKGEIFGCATMKFPNGHTVSLLTFPIHIVADVRLAEFNNNAYAMATCAVDQELLNNNPDQETDDDNPIVMQPFNKQFADLQGWDSMNLNLVNSPQPISKEALEDPIAGPMAHIMKFNADTIPNVNDLLYRILTFGVNPEDVPDVERLIFTTFYCLSVNYNPIK